MGEPHLAVVGRTDDHGVVKQALAKLRFIVGPLLCSLERSDHVDEVLVGPLDQIAVEVEVVELLLARIDRPQRHRELLKEGLRVGFRRQILIVGDRYPHVAFEPHVAVASLREVIRIGQHVVRIDERDDQEELLIFCRIGSDELQDAFVAVRVVIGLRTHVARIVLCLTTTHLGDALVGACVVGVPPLPAVGLQVGRRPMTNGWVVLTDVPLALVDHLIAGRRHDGGDVGEVRRERNLRRVVLDWHALFERGCDVVLGRKESGHQCGAGGRAHARVREGIVERDAVLLERRKARQVLLGPTDREVLHCTFLVGDEHDDVHSLEVARCHFRVRASNAR